MTMRFGVFDHIEYTTIALFAVAIKPQSIAFKGRRTYDIIMCVFAKGAL